jgi:hypothetical protein
MAVFTTPSMAGSTPWHVHRFPGPARFLAAGRWRSGGCGSARRTPTPRRHQRPPAAPRPPSPRPHASPCRTPTRPCARRSAGPTRCTTGAPGPVPWPAPGRPAPAPPPAPATRYHAPASGRTASPRPAAADGPGTRPRTDGWPAARPQTPAPTRPRSASSNARSGRSVQRIILCIADTRGTSSSASAAAAPGRNLVGFWPGLGQAPRSRITAGRDNADSGQVDLDKTNQLSKSRLAREQEDLHPGPQVRIQLGRPLIDLRVTPDNCPSVAASPGEPVRITRS